MDSVILKGLSCLPPYGNVENMILAVPFFCFFTQ